MNWEGMEIFRGIDLNDSFILSWSKDENEVTFDLEASIWPESIYYEQPKSDEYTCYKPATILFNNFKELNGLLEMSEVRPSTDASGEKDYGNIDCLEKTNEGYVIYGDFGSVSIVGGEMYFEIKKT